MENKMRVAIYARVSSDQQAEPDKASLGEQLIGLKEEIIKHGNWESVAELQEVCSGSIIFKERKCGSQIYQMMENQELNLLLVWDNDRIGRDRDGLVAKIFRSDCRKFGIQIYSLHQPVEPKNPQEYAPYEDDSSLWLESVSDTASSVYIRQFSRRHAFGMKKRIESGKITGVPPTGYLLEWDSKNTEYARVLDTVYAPIVKKIFDYYESRSSFMQIAQILNKENLKTPVRLDRKRKPVGGPAGGGKMWTSTTIKGIINNPTYYGAAVYYKDRMVLVRGIKRRVHQPMEKWLVVEPNPHPIHSPIITKEQFYRCQEIKKSKASFGRTYGESSLLSGLVKCGHCGYSMHKDCGWGGGYYTCNYYRKTGKTQCRPNSIRRIHLEEAVINYLASLVKNPECLENLKIEKNNQEAKNLTLELLSVDSQLRQLDTRLAKTREAFEMGIDNASEYSKRKDELVVQGKFLKSKSEEITEKLKNINKGSRVRKSLIKLLEEFPEKFKEKPLRIQKMMLRELIEKIVVKNKKARIIFKNEVFNSSDYERAIEIAAAGGHNLFMQGPPGSGKTMLARALAGILPPLTEEESLEVTKIYSLTGNIPPGGSLIINRPFRASHHTTSRAGLIGGGTPPRPGEISLAHCGVLFLDEFPEFSRSTLEALRQPMEDGQINISRAIGSAKFPSQFTLVAAANPCPCGYLGDPKRECRCSPRQILHYQSKLSGPLLDRIDLHLNVPAVEIEKLMPNQPTARQEKSTQIRKRVIAARKIQTKRFADTNLHTNANMKNKHLKKFCHPTKAAYTLLKQAVNNFNLSARTYFRLIKVSRTIADLNGEKTITESHLAEALQYRLRLQET